MPIRFEKRPKRIGTCKKKYFNLVLKRTVHYHAKQLNRYRYHSTIAVFTVQVQRHVFTYIHIRYVKSVKNIRPTFSYASSIVLRNVKPSASSWFPIGQNQLYYEVQEMHQPIAGLVSCETTSVSAFLSTRNVTIRYRAHTYTHTYIRYVFYNRIFNFVPRKELTTKKKKSARKRVSFYSREQRER